MGYSAYNGQYFGVRSATLQTCNADTGCDRMKQLITKIANDWGQLCQHVRHKLWFDGQNDRIGIFHRRDVVIAAASDTKFLAQLLCFSAHQYLWHGCYCLETGID